MKENDGEIFGGCVRSIDVNFDPFNLVLFYRFVRLMFVDVRSPATVHALFILPRQREFVF